ncbi:MAG TPA: phospholipase D-like domain-containing protein [Mycobacteriales bacterium]|nr:phospholipase D-like domain-containing protein [Mycobacteriales bacterium]
MRRSRLLTAVVVCVCAVGWHVSRGSGSPRAELPSLVPAAARADRLIVEPDDGMQPVYDLLASPKRSLDLTIYELADPTAESILAMDAGRGVHVRVLFDGRLERDRNGPAYAFLRDRGVEVAWSTSRFFATHEKTFVIDGRTAVVMSLNLASSYYATTRDLAVVDHDPADVAAIESVFAADLRGGADTTPAADDLVWSPRQSWADLIALIKRAHRSVAVESEELSSPAVVGTLLDAARRGVRVSVAMTYSDAWRPALTALARSGAQVRVMYGERPLYLHAKLMAIDAGTGHGIGFVGSENLSDASLLHDRELGLVLLDTASVRRIATVIASDLADGNVWPPG